MEELKTLVKKTMMSRAELSKIWMWILSGREWWLWRWEWRKRSHVGMMKNMDMKSILNAGLLNIQFQIELTKSLLEISVVPLMSALEGAKRLVRKE